ncbi:uncharacterized protein PRCAT00002289001 [Priceomyces carsonii]|uniref:uncharacterized protein n=1 Tax=Priceomyces carsonii TaxID=28549 RepID=UPI002EDACEB8|nr:unnamed protein product [Priceomyces carsonii]
MERIYTPSTFQRSDASPRVPESAFPPLRTDHRYRGVYERAGFDVNLKGLDQAQATTGPQIRRFQGDNYPTPPKSSSSNSSASSHSLNGSRSIRANDPYSRPRQTSKSTNEFSKFGSLQSLLNGANNELISKDNGTRRGFSSGSDSAKLSASDIQSDIDHTDRLFSGSSGNYISSGEGSRAISPDSLNFSQKATAQQLNSFSPYNDHKNYENVEWAAGKKNPKNLQLNMQKVQYNQFKSGSRQQDNNPPTIHSAPLDSYNSHQRGQKWPKSATSDKQGFNRGLPMAQSEQNISSRNIENLNSIPFDPRVQKSKTEKFPQRQNQRLSSALFDFKKDIEDHKNYIPKSPASNGAFSPPLPNMSPSELGLGKPQFDSFALQNDYGHIDSSELIDGNSHLRVKAFDRLSQFSTVSSIISKELKRYSDDEEADEIEEDLQRQLDNIKGTTNISPTKATKELPFPSSPKILDSPIPTFNIEDTTEEQTSKPQLPYPTSPDKVTDYMFDLNSPEPSKSAQGAKYFNNHEENALELEQERSKLQTTPSMSKISDSPKFVDESIQPLSPKKHEVEEELKGLNIRMHKADEGGEDGQFIEKGMAASINEPFIYPPGQGPCRKCHEEVSALAKGSEKSIYSKTSNLNGQWHRKCFSCSFENCGIIFSKKVHCYVIEDRPYCHQHYHSLNNTLCSKCHQGIEGECIENELEQKWHLHCLACSRCHNKINEDYFLINETIFCEADAQRIINGEQVYKAADGNLRTGGLLSQDKVEKRRTKIMYVD